jgi:hypothetical protein
VQKRAMENWMARNALILRDAKTHKALNKTPLKVL